MRRMEVVLVALAALAAWPVGSAAQQHPRGERRMFVYGFGDHRARIGVVVRTDASPETDTLGAKIEGVTPGGPADRAGLEVGDIITKFNGTPLARVPAPEEGQSGPGAKLVELARRLAPGDTVRLEYRRGNETKQATLVAEELGRTFEFTMPHVPEIRVLPGEEGMAFCFGDRWCDLDLVKLNPELGEYFGTKEGILVVKAPADSSLPLRSGDVILAIGGRKPASPSHAMRILRSYEPGETVTLDIMRRQRRLSVTWKVPPRGSPAPRRRGGPEDPTGLQGWERGQGRASLSQARLARA